MSYVALYRKYRPNNFSGIVGQEHIVTTLTNQISSGKTSHAYLFTGTRGTGKTSVAKILARALNCLDPVNGDACGKCANCLAASNLDIIDMDAASNNGVDYARDIRDNVQYAPAFGKYKVYIIDEVHMMSIGAFNALLKTIEEPPAHAVFILCTTEIHKVPATILSRCMRFDFALIPVDKLAKLVSDIYDSEGKKYQRDAVYAIAQAGEGSARDSLSIADRCYNLSKGELTYDDVMSVLGSTSRSAINDLADSILRGDLATMFNTIEKLTVEGKDALRINRDLLNHLRDCLVLSKCSASSMKHLPEIAIGQLSSLASSTTTERLLNAIDTLARLESDLRYALSPTTLFEAVLLRIATFRDNMSNDDLLKRVARLEQKLLTIKSNPVDVTNSQSVWKGVLSYLEQLDVPLLVSMWKDSSVEIVSGNLVVTADEGIISVLKQYDGVVSSAVDSLARMTVTYAVSKKKETLTDEQMLKQMSSDIVIK